MKIGYACINITLKEQGISTNRGMKRATFDSKGLAYVSELALNNVYDLYKIINWNISHGIKAYRISSDLFPWMSEYELEQLPDWQAISNCLYRIGEAVNQNDMRVSFHPGAFTILCSPKPDVVRNSIRELNQHCKILDCMGIEISTKHKINIHIGGAYGDKEAAMLRWIENFNLLSPNCKKRLTIENDDKPNMFTVQDLLYVSRAVNIPIVFDFHHYDCNPGNITKQESLSLAISTWTDGITPMTHYSSLKKIYEDSSTKVVSHADYLYDPIPFTDLYKFDVMVEAKAKELAVIKYLNDYQHDS